MSTRKRFRVLDSDGEVVQDNLDKTSAAELVFIQQDINPAKPFTQEEYEHDDGLFKNYGRDPDLH